MESNEQPETIMNQEMQRRHGEEAGGSSLDLMLQEISGKVRDRFGLQEQIRVEFYFYTTLKCTCRLRNGEYRVRLSHLLSDAPESVLEAAVAILIARQTGRPYTGYDEHFKSYVRTNEIRKLIDEHRRMHASKRLRGEKGRHYDLREIFDRVNKEYFDGEIRAITLTWGRRSRRVLGHYDRAKRTIVVSTILDDPGVPSFVVEYILYHELLHLRVPSYFRNGRRVIHPKEFKELEKRFRDYDRVTKRLKQIFKKA